MSKTYIKLPVEGRPEAVIINDGDDELEILQGIVGGNIEMVPLGGGHSLYVNEEGLLIDLPYNELASTIAGRVGQLVGDAVMVGPVDAMGDTGSVRAETVEYLVTMEMK